MINDIQSGFDERVTYRTAFKYFMDMRDVCSKNYMRWEFLSNMSAGEGTSLGIDAGHLLVGIKYFRTMIGSFNLKAIDYRNVNINKFTAVLVAIPHEARHAMQNFEMRYGSDKNSKRIAVCDKAMRHSAVYARTDRNYYNNPLEIDAELYGIKRAYAFCSEHFGDDKANEMICGYVNDRIKHNISFVKPKDSKKYIDVMDVIADFEDALEESWSKHRDYDMDKGKKINDYVYQFFQNHPEYKDEFDRSDGLAQDLQLAAIRNGWYADNDGIDILQELRTDIVFDEESREEMYGYLLHNEPDDGGGGGGGGSSFECSDECDDKSDASVPSREDIYGYEIDSVKVDNSDEIPIETSNDFDLID